MAVTIEALFSGMRQSLRASANNPAIEASAASDQKGAGHFDLIFAERLTSTPYFGPIKRVPFAWFLLWGII